MSAKVDYHVHTSYSDDAVDSPEDLARAAVELGYSTLCLADHVRRESDWVPAWAAEMRRLKDIYSGRIELLAGLEAKVLDAAGHLDLPPGAESLADRVLASFHGIPGEDGRRPAEVLGIWFQAFLAVLENPVVDIIAHPTACLKPLGLEPTGEQMRAIARKAARNDKSLEINRRYNVPDPAFRRILERAGVRLLPGSDSHSLEEFRRG